MTDLVVLLEYPLKDPDNHIGGESHRLLDGRRLSPSRSSLSAVQKTQVEHRPKNLVVDLRTIMRGNFCRANAPTPDLVLWRTLGKSVIEPTVLAGDRRPHLDPTLEHPLMNLNGVKPLMVQTQLE